MRQFVGPVPPRVARLPRDRRGFPVPFFVAWEGGEPVFPVLDPAKLVVAVKHRRCWICGEALGSFKAFCIGPMCCINRLSSEPPSHLDCARFAVLNCSFMAHPLAKRADATGRVAPPGVMIERNPGVVAIWVTKGFAVERHGGGVLFMLGSPERITFWSRGRAATRAEVDESVRTGLPALQEVAAGDGPRARLALQRQVDAFTALLDEAIAAEAA